MGEAPARNEPALHCYLRVGDVTRVVGGLFPEPEPSVIMR